MPIPTTPPIPRLRSPAGFPSGTTVESALADLSTYVKVQITGLSVWLRDESCVSLLPGVVE